MATIKDIEGISDIYAQKLGKAGITTIDDLLERCAFLEDEQSLAKDTGISVKLIRKWVSNAELFRIKGVGEEYADLLVDSGIKNIADLANSDVGELYTQLTIVNQEKSLVRKLPTKNQVDDWVEQAVELIYREDQYISSMFESLKDNREKSVENWWKLRDTIFVRGELEDRLISKEKIERLFSELENENIDQIKKIAILRLKAIYFSNYPDEAIREKIFHEILDICTSKTITDVDYRGWAIYFLRKFNITVTSDELDVILEFLNDPSAKVRHWTATVLGMIAAPETRRSKRVKLCLEKNKDNYLKVQNALVKRWFWEFDGFVQEEIIVALGMVVGRSEKSVKHKNGQSHTYVDILKAAAGSPYPYVISKVPGTITNIAENMVRSNLDPMVVNNVFEKDLADSLDYYITKIHARTPEDYEQIRRAIKALADLIPCALTLEGINSSDSMFASIIEKVLAIPLGEQYYPKESVQARAIQALKDISLPDFVKQEHKEIIENKIQDFMRIGVIHKVRAFIAHPNPDVAFQSTETYNKFEQAFIAANWYVDIILEDTDIGELENSWNDLCHKKLYFDPFTVRNRAAKALATMRETNKVEEAFKRLIDALDVSDAIDGENKEIEEYQNRAKMALRDIGGDAAVNALVASGFEAQLKEYYFDKINDANLKGEQITQETIDKTSFAIFFSISVSMIVVIAGIVILGNSLQVLNDPELEADDINAMITAIVGAATALTGILVPYFFNPAKHIWKANTEMAKIVTAFHGYMGRMQLIGIGFARLFSKGQLTETAITIINENMGKAMKDSAGILADIKIDDVSSTTQTSSKNIIEVPDFKGVTLEKAQELAKGKVEIKYGDEIYSDVEKFKIADQNPAAKSAVEEGATITLHQSKGKETVLVPTLKGLTLPEASKTIKGESLGIGEVFEEESTETSNTVIKVDPLEGKEVSKGSMINLTLSKEKQAE